MVWLLVGLGIGSLFGYMQGWQNGYCAYWKKDFAREMAMSPEQWRAAYGRRE